MNQTPTRYFSGVTNSFPFPFNMMGNYNSPMPMAVPQDFDDFMGTYTAGQWTVTTSSGTTADTAGNGGLVLQSTAASNNDIQFNQRPTAKFAVVAGNQMWFAANFQGSVASASQYMIGLGTSMATMAPTAGLYFEKALAGTTLNFVIRNASVSTTIPITTAFNAAQNYGVGFYYDGRGDPTLYVFCSASLSAPVAFGRAGFPIGPCVATASASGTYTLANIPTVNLAPGFGVKAGAVAITTMTTDYILSAADAVRY